MAGHGDHGERFAMHVLTPRLELRPVCTGDRHDLHRLEQDPEVMRVLNGGLPKPREPLTM